MQRFRVCGADVLSLTAQDIVDCCCCEKMSSSTLRTEDIWHCDVINVNDFGGKERFVAKGRLIVRTSELTYSDTHSNLVSLVFGEGQNIPTSNFRHPQTCVGRKQKQDGHLKISASNQ